MVKTYSNDFITWNGGLLHRGTSHLYLWSDNARGWSHRLGLWGHFSSEFCEEDEKKKKRLEAFLKFLKILDADFNGEEKSLMMTLKRLLSFYKYSNRPRYEARISRLIIVRRVEMHLERGSRVLGEQRLFKLRQTRGDTPRTLVSRLTESRLFSKERSASPPWSLRHFNKVRAASPLQRPCPFSILWPTSWQNQRAAPLLPTRVAPLLRIKFAFCNA